MNIHEMNGSGPRIYVFFIAIIIISGLAIMAWRATSLFLEWHRRWQSRDHEGISIINRLKAVLWLVRKRRTAWMIQNGVLPSLLTDGRLPIKDHSSFAPNQPVDFLNFKFSQSTHAFESMILNKNQ